MSDSGEAVTGTGFRPFFWVDGQLRVREWPELTARALAVPAAEAIGRRCSEVLRGCFTGREPPCAACRNDVPRRSATSSSRPDRAAGCARLPVAQGDELALVWAPLSRLVSGDAGHANTERLLVRGALAAHLGSIEETLEWLRRACAADDCELFLLDASGREVFLVDCEGLDRDAFMQITRMPLGTGYPGLVTQAQRPLFTNHLQQDGLLQRADVRRCGIRSLIGVPLASGGRALGYLGLGWRDERVPMDWALRLLQDLKALIPLAIPRPRAVSPALDAPQQGLAVRCLGAWQVRVDGVTLPPSVFGRRKAVELLQHLVLARGRPLVRERLVDLLWPDAGPDAGNGRLHVVVNALRTALAAGGPAGAAGYVVWRGDGYALDLARAHAVDLYEFLDRVAAARRALRAGNEVQALAWQESAQECYGGTLFADQVLGDELEGERARLARSFIELSYDIVGTRLRWGQLDGALRAARHALDIEPLAPDLHELLISLLQAGGRAAEARRATKACRALLGYAPEVESSRIGRVLRPLR